MKFRPCIDLHDGKVVQIVGGTLSDSGDQLQTNFTSEKAPADYAALYKRDGLTGGHVISLGGGNQDAAMSALSAFPGGMQYGGGVNPDNAAAFLDAGASHVIVTSYLFTGNELDYSRLKTLVDRVGRDRLVIDLSCRSRDGEFYVVTNRWQTFTSAKVNDELLKRLSDHCSEFLVHGVDVEGLRQGIQEELIVLLAENAPCPVTYAGGVRRLEDLALVDSLGQGRVDLTIGSALDIFGGAVPYDSVLKWCAARH